MPELVVLLLLEAAGFEEGVGGMLEGGDGVGSRRARVEIRTAHKTAGGGTRERKWER